MRDFFDSDKFPKLTIFHKGGSRLAPPPMDSAFWTVFDYLLLHNDMFILL